MDLESLRQKLLSEEKEAYKDKKKGAVQGIWVWLLVALGYIGIGFLFECCGLDILAFLTKMTGTFSLSGSMLNIHKIYIYNKEIKHNVAQKVSEEKRRRKEDEYMENLDYKQVLDLENKQGVVESQQEFCYNMTGGHLRNAFIHRAEELETYIQEFKYPGYQTDLLALLSLLGSYEAGIEAGDISELPYYEALNEMERAAIEAAASMQLETDMPSGRTRVPKGILQ